MTTPNFSIEHLTLGELAQLEELSGVSMTEMGDTSAPKAKFLTALAYLAKRRNDPSFTFSQAEALTVAELNEVLGADASGEESAA
jgi:hypothetical protein